MCRASVTGFGEETGASIWLAEDGDLALPGAQT
jgi:hypothetical protein